MNFFEIVNSHLGSLTKSEQALFDYVVKNMDKIKNQRIREVAGENFVSTATFLRFVKKIGFSGFSEFTTVIKYTVINSQHVEDKAMPFTIPQKDYREEYLKNIIESVRVVAQSKIQKIVGKLASHPTIYFFSKGVSKYATEYIYYLYTMAGFSVVLPKDHEMRRVNSRQVKSDDIVFILTYSGRDGEFLEMMNQFSNSNRKPFVISITEPDNNTIQNLSDINLYIFTDEIKVNEADISSRISTVALMELVLYQYIESYGDQDYNFRKNDLE